jgi:hypothetical protein
MLSPGAVATDPMTNNSGQLLSNRINIDPMKISPLCMIRQDSVLSTKTTARRLTMLSRIPVGSERLSNGVVLLDEYLACCQLFTDLRAQTPPPD